MLFKRRVPISIVTSMIACHIISCSSQNDLGRPVANIDKINVTGCNRDVCSSIYMSVSFVNDTEVPYCIPAEYFNEYAAESLFIFYGDDNQPLERNRQSRIIDALAAKDKSVYVNWLREQPNYVVQPHETMKRTIYINEDYTLKIAPAHVMFQVYSYPCANSDYKKRGFIKSAIRSNLSFGEMGGEMGGEVEK